MATLSKIEWTEAVWNPTTGCSKVSAGCKHCYAERMSRRLQAVGLVKYRNGFRVTLHPELLEAPKSWLKPRLVFVDSMSDLFHEDVPPEFIRQVFAVMNDCSRHTFQVLTKRSNRLRALAAQLQWTPNIWMGVTVENAEVMQRIDDLRTVPAVVRFLSCEPLLGPLEKLPLDGIHWVIVGGESGPGARPMHKVWVLSILEQCQKAGVPFFFKQWGGTKRNHGGRNLNGRTYDETPKVRLTLDGVMGTGYGSRDDPDRSDIERTLVTEGAC